MSERFTDHFQSVADQYAASRPGYPPTLFDWLAAQAGSRGTAWDCGTGSGQAALDLARVFRQVVATDASAAQIAQAPSHPRIDYRVAPAEASGLADASVDLVVVAQALHWFDVDAFHREARRVLRDGAVIAEWSYGILAIDDGPLDAILADFYTGIVGPFWPPERRHVENGYRELPFPFEPIDTPAFGMAADWTLAELVGYLRSWSATARYIAERGHDPVASIAARLAPAWGEAGAVRRIRWPLALRVGRA